jgi:hypothetical protein
MQAERMSQAARSVRFLRDYNEQPFISYEREELVEKLCQSEDPGLREVGFRELENIKLRDPTFKIIMKR